MIHISSGVHPGFLERGVHLYKGSYQLRGGSRISGKGVHMYKGVDGSMIQVFKIIKGNDDIPIEEFFQISESPIRCQKF